MPPGEKDADLAASLAAVLGGAVRIAGLRRLSGGASRETWSFDAVGAVATQRLVLRRDPPGSVRAGATMTTEAHLLRAAAAGGVPVPAVVTADDDPEPLGGAFLVMERIEGETIPQRILRRPEYAQARSALAAQCGTALARIHAMARSAAPGLVDESPLQRYGAILEQLGEPHPALELARRALARDSVAAPRTTVVHGDFRNGNFVVGPEGLRAVLDWELAHCGDPIEDLGWLCVRAWRFGAERPVGGFGERSDLVRAYRAEGGDAVDEDALRWWEAMGTLRWAVMCIVQASLHWSGVVRSVELAAIGRRVCENEWDLLELLGWGAAETSAADAPPAPPGAASGSLHDRPSAAELVEAVGEFLRDQVMTATEGRVQYLVRVAANALSIVEREMAAPGADAAAHVRALMRLGVPDDTALCAAIRSGALDDRLGDVAASVRSNVAAKLRVANPRYIESRPLAE